MACGWGVRVAGGAVSGPCGSLDGPFGDWCPTRSPLGSVLVLLGSAVVGGATPRHHDRLLSPMMHSAEPPSAAVPAFLSAGRRHRLRRASRDVEDRALGVRDSGRDDSRIEGGERRAE